MSSGYSGGTDGSFSSLRISTSAGPSATTSSTVSMWSQNASSSRAPAAFRQAAAARSYSPARRSIGPASRSGQL